MLEDKSEARHPMQRDDPEPAALTAEMAGGIDVGKVAGLLPRAVPQNFRPGVVRQLLIVDQTFHPAPRGAMFDGAFLLKPELLLEYRAAAGTVDHPPAGSLALIECDAVRLFRLR